jgi:hypothetical protein
MGDFELVFIRGVKLDKSRGPVNKSGVMVDDRAFLNYFSAGADPVSQV